MRFFDVHPSVLDHVAETGRALVIVLVPDTAEVEYFANGQLPPEPTQRFVSSSGRHVCGFLTDGALWTRRSEP